MAPNKHLESLSRVSPRVWLCLESQSHDWSFWPWQGSHPLSGAVPVITRCTAALACSPSGQARAPCQQTRVPTHTLLPSTGAPSSFLPVSVSASPSPASGCYFPPLLIKCSSGRKERAVRDPPGREGHAGGCSTLRFKPSTVLGHSSTHTLLLVLAACSPAMSPGV